MGGRTVFFGEIKSGILLTFEDKINRIQNDSISLGKYSYAGVEFNVKFKMAEDKLEKICLTPVVSDYLSARKGKFCSPFSEIPSLFPKVTKYCEETYGVLQVERDESAIGNKVRRFLFRKGINMISCSLTEGEGGFIVEMYADSSQFMTPNIII